MLLAILIGAVIELVAHFSPAKPWMAIVSYIVGIGLALMFLVGGDDA